MLSPGQILDGKYEIIRVLGQGGMGIVYLCKNNRLGNLWAVKEVNSDWNAKVDFLAEPNILKKLNHIGIVRIIDIFYQKNNLYIVEDYIEGDTLKDYVDSHGALSYETAIDIALQLCSILSYLHSFNPPIIYRDLKPSNVMIKPDNKVVLIDFGIARIYKEGQQSDTVVLGSKGYISPEQLGNVQSNAQTDIYSLGATMFFMLTGKSISLPTELMYEESYPEGIPKNLIGIIQKASAIEPSNRYRDVEVMVPELNAALEETRYAKTKLLSFNKASEAPYKTTAASNGKPKKKTKIIIIAVLVCIIALSVLSAYLLSGKTSDKASSRTPAKTASQTETKPEAMQEPQPPKEVVEKDTVTRGVLDSKKPVILSSGSSNVKGKDKNDNKNVHIQFALNPAASVSNSKLSVALTHIQVIEDDVIAVLSIQNTADAALKIDLNKTYLVNGKNESTKSYNPSSASLLAIPQSSNKQELKLYFKDFNFEGDTYTLKTVLSSASNKDINLFIDIK